MPFGFEKTPASLFIVLRISRRQGRCYAALILTGFRHFRNRLTLLGRPLGSRGLAPEPSATAGRAGSTGQLNDIFPLPISTFIRSNALIPSSGSGIGLPTSIASTLFRTQEPISSRFSQKSVIGYLVPSAVDAVDLTDDEFKPTPSLPAAARGNATIVAPVSTRKRTGIPFTAADKRTAFLSTANVMAAWLVAGDCARDGSANITAAAMKTALPSLESLICENLPKRETSSTNYELGTAFKHAASLVNNS